VYLESENVCMAERVEDLHLALEVHILSKRHSLSLRIGDLLNSNVLTKQGPTIHCSKLTLREEKEKKKRKKKRK